MSNIDLKSVSEEYSKYFDTNLDDKLKPIHQSIDDMLTRLEEFQTMLAMLQQERCTALGLTGSLTQTVESFGELKDLCARIDALEKLVEHVKNNLDSVEKKMDAAEEQHGLTDSTTKIKSLFLPLFKKSTSTKEIVSNSDMEIFTTEEYFES